MAFQNQGMYEGVSNTCDMPVTGALHNTVQNQICVTGYSLKTAPHLMNPMIRQHFSQYGEVLDVQRLVEKKGKMTIVTFLRPESVQRCTAKKVRHSMVNHQLKKCNQLNVSVWTPGQQSDAGLPSKSADKQNTQNCCPGKSNASNTPPVGSASDKPAYNQIRVTGYSKQVAGYLMNDMLKQYFSHYGEVLDVCRPEEKHGQLSIVTFANPQSVLQCTYKQTMHLLPTYGKVSRLHVTVWKKGLPGNLQQSFDEANFSNSDLPPPDETIPNVISCKGYTKKLVQSKMNEILKDYFSQFGAVEDVYRPKGRGFFTFVMFVNSESVDNCLKRTHHQIRIDALGKSNQLQVSRCTYKDRGMDYLSKQAPNVTDNVPDEQNISKGLLMRTASEITKNALLQDAFDAESLNTTYNNATKIFCSGYPMLVNDEIVNLLKDHFSYYGDILNINCPDQFGGSICIISFKFSSSVLKVMDDFNKHKIFLSNSSDCYNLYVDVYYENKNTSDLTFITILDHQFLAACSTVSNQITEFVHSFTLSEKDNEDRKCCFNKLIGTLKFKFSKARALPFGPSVNNFGFKGCSFDILFEQTPDCLANESFVKETSHLAEMKKKLLIQLYSLLIPNKPTDEVIALCNHNYINVIHKEKNINCRIWCNNMFPVYNSDLLKFYSKLDPRVTPLMMVVRFWAKHQRIYAENSVQETSKLSDNALTWILIFFLQNTDPPILPTVNELMARTRESRKVCGFETAFCSDINSYESSSNTTPTKILLHQFFHFCYNYNYGLVMCPRTGQASLRKYLMSDENSEKQFQNSLLCVQDPLEITRNITFDIGSELFTVFLSKCRVSYTFNPSEIKNSPNFRLWGLLHLFTALPSPTNVNLQWWKFSSMYNYSSVKVFIQYADDLIQKVIASAPDHCRQNSNFFCELVTAMILYIFNQALLFDARVSKWEVKPTSKQDIASDSQDNDETSTETECGDKQATENARKRAYPNDEPEIHSAKRFHYDQNARTNVSLAVHNVTCDAYIQASFTHNTWSQRWKYNVVESNEIQSGLFLNQDKCLSLLLQKGQQPLSGSFTCHCSFNEPKGFSVELQLDKELTDATLFLFLIYFIPLKINELFDQKIHDLDKHLQKDFALHK